MLVDDLYTNHWVEKPNARRECVRAGLSRSCHCRHACQVGACMPVCVCERVDVCMCIRTLYYSNREQFRCLFLSDNVKCRPDPNCDFFGVSLANNPNNYHGQNSRGM